MQKRGVSMQILGLHSLGHDTGACLWEGGQLIYAIEAERLTRRRHETAIAAAVQVIVAHPRFRPDQGMHIASSSHFSPDLLEVPDRDRAMTALVQDHALHYDTTCRFQGMTLPCTIVSHEVSHAVLALEKAEWADGTTVLINEGRGVFSRNALYHYAGGVLKLVEFNLLPWFATGFGWSSLGYLIGLGRNPSVAGKAMALSAFQPVGDSECDALLAVPRHLPDMAEAEKEAEGKRLLHLLGTNESFDARCRLVAALQSLFTQALLEALKPRLAALGSKQLALSGGCALNIIANSVLRQALSIPVIIPSACNDSGQALGAALYVQHFVLGQTTTPFSAYSIGDPITSDTTEQFLRARGIASQEATPDAVADLLAKGKVVALAQGRSEIGPRALGNRSLLADPNAPGIKAHVSETLKGRENFRPLAPIMRVERFNRLFPNDPDSPEMLFNYDVTGMRFGGAAHVDGTARIQTVTAASNPLVHGILAAFESRSSSPALINTSLNAGGRPICLTEADVLDDFPLGCVGAYVLADRLIVNG
jgi:carbamoyltransferase